MRRDEKRSVIFKILYPNGKIYVGKDETNSINYFGSASSALIARDFTSDEIKSFTITRELIWESNSASVRDLNQMELAFIRSLESNHPDIGYNRWPRVKDAL